MCKGGREIWEDDMKAPSAFCNIYNLLDLLPSQARVRVGELLAISHQRPSQLQHFGWLVMEMNEIRGAGALFEAERATIPFIPFWAVELARRDLHQLICPAEEAQNACRYERSVTGNESGNK